MYLKFRVDQHLRIFSLFLAFSFVCFSLSLLKHAENKVLNFDLTGKKSIIASVKSLPRVYQSDKNKSVFFLAHAQQIIYFEGDHKRKTAVDEAVYVMLFQADKVPVLGDEILLYGDIDFLPNRLNRFEKDYWRQWRKRNLNYVFSGYGGNSLEILQKKNKLMYFLRDLQGRIEVSISRLWQNPIQESYFKALLLGQKQSISKVDREAFAKTGVAHILVVSGLHVTLAASFMMLFLFFVGYKAATVSLLTSIFIIFYAVLANLGLPVIRASVMSILILTSFLIKRSVHSLNFLFFAASALLIFDLTVLFDISFQLSFLSVLAILMSNVISFKTFIDPRYLSFFSFAAVMKKTAVIMLFTLPILALFFHEVSWVGLFTNILVIPCFSLATFFAFFAFGMEGIIFLPSLFADMAGSIILWTRAGILYLSKLPFVTIHLLTPTPIQTVFYYLALGLIFYSYRHFKKPGFAKILQLSCCSLFYMTIFLITLPRPSGMYFNFFSTPKSFNCLLDFGESQKWMLSYQRGSSSKNEKNILEGYFDARGLKEITGLLTSGVFLNKGKRNQKNVFFRYVLSTNGKFEDQKKSDFQRKMKKQDKVVLTENKINIEILAIKNNEAIWHIYGDGASLLFIPFYERKLIEEISLNLKSAPNLIIYVPSSRPDDQQIQALEYMFGANTFIVNQLPHENFDTTLDLKNFFSLELDGEVSVKVHKGIFTYRSFNELKNDQTFLKNRT